MKHVLLMLGIAALIGCKKNEAADDARVIQDVAYGPDARQKMDIYLPAGRSEDSTPVVFMIHGGAWTEGDKADFVPYVNVLRQRLPEYAIVNINYRLAVNGSNTFPAQENDVKEALNFIHERLGEYKLDDRFALIGASAGAHLVMLQAYKHTSPVTPRAIVSLFGPGNLNSLYTYHPLLAAALVQVTGGTPASHPDVYQQSSPLNFISASSPPTLLFQGGADPVVPPAQAVELREKLEAAGVVHQYVYYPAEGHGWTGNPLNDTFDKIEAFLRGNLQ